MHPLELHLSDTVKVEDLLKSKRGVKWVSLQQRGQKRHRKALMPTRAAGTLQLPLLCEDLGHMTLKYLRGFDLRSISCKDLLSLRQHV